MSDVSTTSRPSHPSGSGPAARAGRYASYVFWLMFLINFLNYADRFVFTALANVLKSELNFNDSQIGLLSSAFLLVYTIVAFPLGFVADRVSRKLIVALGVGLWSVATAMTALIGSFWGMVGIRALVGVGEGSYYPAGTPMLAAWYPPGKRASVLARWGVGSLVGAGVGFLVASFLAGPQWRLAFFATGAPGLVLAVLIGLTRERVRHEDDPPEEHEAIEGSFWQRVRLYLRIRTLRVILAMHALGFFALTALTTFLVIYLGATYGTSTYGKDGLSEKMVVLIPGVLLLLGGIGGNLFGSWWANRLSRRTTGARVLTGGLGFLIAAPLVILVLTAPAILGAIPAYAHAATSTQVSIGVAAFAILGVTVAFFLNVYNGPTSAALQDVVPPAARASAGGLELTLAHLLGDSYAGAAVGGLSFLLGTALGGEQIGLALLLTCPVVLVASGIVGIWGSRFYAPDVEALGSSSEAMLGIEARVD